MPGRSGRSTDAVVTMEWLHRLRRRCQKLRRLTTGNLGSPAWTRWSEAVDELDALFVEIARMPIRTIADAAVRYEAVAMELADGDLILDNAALRRVEALRRDLRKLG